MKRLRLSDICPEDQDQPKPLTQTESKKLKSQIAKVEPQGEHWKNQTVKLTQEQAATLLPKPDRYQLAEQVRRAVYLLGSLGPVEEAIFYRGEPWDSIDDCCARLGRLLEGALR